MFKKAHLNFIVGLLVFLLPASVLVAEELTSTNFKIKDPVIGTEGGYGSSDNFGLFSSGDKLFTDDASSASFLNRYGFLYYPFADSGVLSAAANGSQADLSWTASEAGGGWTISGYKTGKSSIPGGPYTYTLVGNVLSYSYTELAPGDYCFVVQTLDALSNVIITSNEDCVTIQPSLVFDLDTASDFGNGESAGPYSVDLGVISTSSVKASNSSTVRMIVAEADTNATGGLVITVANSNGVNGLVSASVPADNIGSATGTMSAGTENYGLCVATSGLIGFSRSTGYSSDTCALGSGTNGVRGLSTTPTSILNSGGSPVYSAHAEIVVNGGVSGVTPAHTDYSDSLIFIATSTF